MSAEVLHKRARKFERTIFLRNGREYGGALIAALAFGAFATKTHDVLFRIAYALLIAGLGWVVFQLHRKGAARDLSTAMGTSACLQFLRSELERQRDLIANVWPWYLAPLVPGFIALTVAGLLAGRYPVNLATVAWLDGIVALVFWLVWKMNQRAARSLQRSIDELNSAESQH